MMSHPPTPTPSDSGTSAESTALGRALDVNAAVKDIVEQSAAELVVINTVLKQEIPDDVQTGDVAQALLRTDALEVKISDAAQDLAQVNEVLAQEIDQRVDLERELAQTKAALAEAQHSSGQN